MTTTEKKQMAQKTNKEDVYSRVIKTIEEGDYVQSFCHLWSLIHTNPWSGEGTK